MVARMFSRTLCCVFVLTLACGTLLAQTYQIQKPRSAHTKPSLVVTPAEELPAGLKTIYSNLGPTATDNYNASSGYYITGPTNALAVSEQWIAAPFTPKVNAHVSQLRVAAGWISGTKRIIVGLYSDNLGTVGTALATAPTTHMGTFGACCQLASVNIASTAVTKGTQYWIVVTSDDTLAPDFAGVFESSNDVNTAGDVALGGWFTFSNNWPAAAAAGTIP
jgi:hypothetical protein